MKALKNIIAIALPILIMASCRPDQPTDPGPAYGAGGGVVGTWVQTGGTIYDITLPVAESRDVTSFFTKTGNNWIVTFSEDGSYTIDQTGKGPNPFGTAGTWAFDTAYYPTEMMITPSGETGKTFTMLNAPRENDINFGLGFEVEKCGTPVSRYEFVFTRQQ